MAKSAKSKSLVWTKLLNEPEVREALDEATVDCYNNESEQHTGLLTMIEEQVAFPFQAKVLGDVATVVGMEWPADDEFGLDLVCERGGEQHRIKARSVELLPPFPDGHHYLAADLESL